MSPSQRDSWLHVLGGWREGMGYPGGKAASSEDIDVGVMEYLVVVPPETRDFSPRHVLQFVESARLRRTTAPKATAREGYSRWDEASIAEQAMRVADAFGTITGGQAA